MPRFAANLGFLFPEVAFLDRFAAAAAAGFRGVEFASPYPYPAREIRSRLDEHGLECVLFNLPLLAGGEGPRAGIGCRPESVGEFRAGVERALEYAAVLGNRRINCIAGTLRPGDDPAACERTLIDNLRYAAPRLAAAGIALLLEPINSRDTPGFFVATADHGARIVAGAGENVSLQCDLYHTAMMGDDPARVLAQHRDIIGHIQFADAPGRGEPGSGSIDFAPLFAAIDASGYRGWVAAEYRPTRPTPETLQWLTADS